jgi:hypothetical protein
LTPKEKFLVTAPLTPEDGLASVKGTETPSVEEIYKSLEGYKRKAKELRRSRVKKVSMLTKLEKEISFQLRKQKVLLNETSAFIKEVKAFEERARTFFYSSDASVEESRTENFFNKLQQRVQDTKEAFEEETGQAEGVGEQYDTEDDA